MSGRNVLIHSSCNLKFMIIVCPFISPAYNFFGKNFSKKNKRKKTFEASGIFQVGIRKKRYCTLES